MSKEIPPASPHVTGTLSPASSPSPDDVPVTPSSYTNQELMGSLPLDALFRGISVTSEGQLLLAAGESAPASPPLASPERFTLLLPTQNVELTAQEARLVRVYQEARLVLGAAGSVSLTCAASACPFAKRCPLMKIKKAPLDEVCPFEANYVVERFTGWLREFKRSEEHLLESERVTIANLVYLDVQEQRCLNILADAKNASLTSLAVKDADPETGQALSWEEIIHANAVRLNEITTQRRMLMKDFELTPEQKTKRARYEGRSGGRDLSSRQSAARDRLTAALERDEVIDVDIEPVADEVRSVDPLADDKPIR